MFNQVKTITKGI